MNKRIYCALAAALCICMAVCGCAKEAPVAAGQYEEGENSEAGLRRTVLYYQDDDGFIVPVMKLIPWEEGIGKAALSNLVDTKENRAAATALGLKTTIPEGVEYTLRIRDDGVATIDLKGLTALPDKSSEQAMVTSIVNSLAEFPAIDAVTITLNGEKVTKLPNGTELKEAMKPFMLNAEEGDLSASADGAKPLTLYFANSSGSLNVPVTRYCEGGTGFKTAVEELIKGPDSAALMNSFPEGTELLSAELYDGVARVDLSGEFLAAQYVDGMAETAFDTLFLTASAIDDVYELDLFVEGEPCALTVNCMAPMYANSFQ